MGLPIPMGPGPVERDDRAPAARVAVEPAGPPPEAKVEFLMFGYRDAEGRVYLYGSTVVPWVEVSMKGWEDDVSTFCDPGGFSRLPPVVELRARMSEVTAAFGATVQEALVALGTMWGRR